MKVVVSEFMDKAALQAFGPHEVLYAPELVDDPSALARAISDADALIVRNRTNVSAELLEQAPKLKVVGRLGVGLDNIDLDACEKRGVEVRPATGANALSVAEYVIATALMLLRGAFAAKDAMLAGKWPRPELVGSEASGKAMALWGFGSVAQVVARHASAIGMEVMAHDPYLDAEDPAWSQVRRCESSEDLVSAADVLSLHVPLTDGTRNMVDARCIAGMHQGAMLINTARGGIVDEKALVDALRSGHLGGAAIDVFANEPLDADSAKLFKDVPNLVLTPHIAGVTKEGDVRVSALTVSNVLKVLEGG